MEIYLVGGAVRDKLLGLEVKDRDYVVVGATPEELVKRNFKPVGADFPVFLHPETKEEYALARTERKTGRGYKGFTVYAAPDVTLEDFEVPPALHALFRGPRFGLAGLRERTGVPTRPLTATALKPVGLSVDTLAALCRTFAEGGIDLIKDDHYLADHAFCPFEERVRACQAAVDEVEARTGHRTLYLPNLSGTPDQVHRQADLAQQIGVRAVMAAPMLLGLPAFYDLIHTRLEVPVLAHPSFAGGLRIRPATLLGKLFRLFGADAVIFPNYGGRFHFSREQCAGIARTLRADWGPYRPAFPVPAGGMNVERVPELITFFGLDTVLLIGGSLLEAGQALRERTQALVASVEQAARQYRATAEERG